MPQVLKEEIANKIIEVATEQFYEHGFKATTMRDIANGAGIPVGLLYTYNKNKKDLFDKVVRPVVNLLCHTLHNEPVKGKETFENLMISEAMMLLELMEKKRKPFLILMDKSKGTQYENALDDMIEETTEHIKNHLRSRIDYEIYDVNDTFYHILATNYVEGLLEVARHYKDALWAKQMITMLNIQYLYGVTKFEKKDD